MRTREEIQRENAELQRLAIQTQRIASLRAFVMQPAKKMGTCSTPQELCDWMNNLSKRIGTGLLHEVQNHQIRAYIMHDEVREEVY